MVDFVSISVAVISLVLAVIGIGLGGYCLNQLNSQTTNGKVGPPGPPGPPGTPGSGSGTGGGSNVQSSNFTTEQERKLKIFIDQMNILESEPKVFDVNGVIGAIRLQTDRINFKNSRWSIRPEANDDVFVIRDTTSTGDNRFAFYKAKGTLNY